MKKNDFFEQLAEQLEFDDIELNESTVLVELDGFDSMAVMSIIAFADEKFDKQLSAEQLKSITTIKSLMELIGLDKFE